MKRILVPLGSAELGGGQQFLLRLVDALGPNDFQFSVWLFSNGPMEKACEAQKVPYRIFSSTLLRTPWGLLRLRKILIQEAPDMIYLHASRVISWLAKGVGIPCVERINMSRTPAAGGWSRFAWLDRYFTNLNTRCIAVSQAIQKQLLARGVPQEKIALIYNFVDPTAFYQPEKRKPTRKTLGIPEDAVVVLNAGRLVPQKAQTDFLKVARFCCDQDKNFYFLLLGEGPLQGALKKEKADLGLDANVQILSFQKDMAGIYAASDMLLHTAHWEPLANVLLEAIAARLGIVATDVDGTAEATRDYPCKALVPPGDTKKIAQAVLEIRKMLPLKEAFTAPKVFQKEEVCAQFRLLVEEVCARGR